MNKQPLFSFVLSDCDSVVTEQERARMIDSIKAQTFKDFELVLMHDGPRTSSKAPEDERFINISTPSRARLGGDDMRTPGMKAASGKFIINGNVDNMYYPDFLERLAKEVQTYPQFGVFICKVKMMGMDANGGLHYDNPRDYSKFTILHGIPPVVCNIDIMNLIAAKKIFEETGFWHNIGSVSDGIVYQNICEKYMYKAVDVLVGEHY